MTWRVIVWCRVAFVVKRIRYAFASTVEGGLLRRHPKDNEIIEM
jgi:hypothetical protein